MFFKKSYIIYLLILLFSPITLLSQNQKLDSLLHNIEGITKENESNHFENIADEYIKISNYTLAIVYYKKSIKATISKKQTINLKNKLGRTYFFISDYAQAIEFLNSSLILAEELNDTINLSLILNNIGIIYQKTSNYKKSIEYLKRSIKYKILLNDSIGIANTYNNLGNAFYESDLNKALEFYEKSLTVRKIIKDSVGIGVSYNNIGLIYFEQANYADALQYFRFSLKIKETIKDKKSIAITLNNIAEVLVQTQDYAKAIKYSNKSLNIAKDIGALLQIANAYTTLSSSYEKKNDYKNAYKFHKLYKTTTDSIFNNKSHNKITQIENQYQLNKKEQEIKIDKQKIKLLEKENKLKQVSQNFFIVGIILFFIIISIVIYTLILRNKNTRQKLIISSEEKQIQNLKIEKQNLENNQLKDELDLKKRELTSKAMMLVKNNTIILNILKDINEIKQSANKKSSLEINSLIQKYKISENDFNWQEFKLLFEEVHQDFYSNLTNKYTNLTPSEIKLCAFFRLNLSSKEIASITFKSPNTIKTARKRLRKKLNISTETNLVSFISKI